jgi:alpha-N-arabinofuranosidase
MKKTRLFDTKTCGRICPAIRHLKNFTSGKASGRLKQFVLSVTFIFCLFPVSYAQSILKAEKTAEKQVYDPMIFGQFIEHFHRQIYGGIFEPGSPLSNSDGFRTDVIEALRELKIPIVRWPGGCFVSAYHWLDGVGPNRQSSLDKAWNVEEPNTFGTVEFVKWCRLIGAEPFICTNAGTGTQEEMSDWVEYCNLNIGKFARLRKSHGIEEPLNVKYWSIGNENYGHWEMGAKTVSEWGPFVKEAAKMMRSADANIKLFAAALPDEKWTLPLLQVAGDWLNYVSIHGYWNATYAENKLFSYINCMMLTEEPDKSIKQTINVLEKAGLRGRVKIAYDEWNLRGWHHPDSPGGGANHSRIIDRDKNDINSSYTMADAVFSACFLNTCLRNCKDVEIGGFSPIVNTRGALFVHPKGIVKRTTFHILSMYANMLEKNYLPAELQSEVLTHNNRSVPALDAVITCNDAKTHFTIAVANKSPNKEIELSLNIAELTGPLPKQVKAVILSGSSPDDYNEVGSENRVVPIEKNLKLNNGRVAIPPHSVVMLRL